MSIERPDRPSMTYERIRLIVGLPLILLAGIIAGVVGMLTNGRGRS